MARLLVLFCCLFAALAAPARAQTALPDLRGSQDILLPSDAQEEEAAATAQTPAENPTRSNVFSLRRTLNASEAEDGSTGLGGDGRVLPIRPFSDRLAAVARNDAGLQTSLDDSVFGGDTTFDTPEGIRLGTFTLIPQVTVSGGWTDNTAQSASGESGSFYSIAPDLSLTSDWSRHELSASLRGTYNGYPSAPDDNDLSASASANLRLDISNATTLRSGLSYSYSREEDSSAESASGADNVHQLSGSTSLTRDAGLVSLTASLGADKSIYRTDNGGSSGGRDNTLYSAGLRVDGNGGRFSPFAEAALLLRRYDETCSDALCEKRDANGYELRGGLTVVNGPKLSGEIGAGWRIEDLEDSRLEDLAGLVVDGSLVWSPTRLTTVTAGLGTTFAATDIDGASGSIIYSGDIRLAHAFSDRLVGEAGLGYSHRVYQGASIEENTLTGFGGATYALSKNVALTTRYTYRRFDSSQAGNDYDQNMIEAGLRFRH